MPYNWKKHYALKQRFDSEYNWLPESSGIYLWSRWSEEKQRDCFYVGQAKNLKNRIFDYYKIICGLDYPKRKFEASLKKHSDWEVKVLETCPIEELDKQEKYWIDFYMKVPNSESYNKEAETDIVRSNAKRIHNVYTKYENNIKKMLKHLIISFLGNEDIHITIKRKKSGIPTRKSQNALTELTNWLKGLIENGVH